MSPVVEGSTDRHVIWQGVDITEDVVGSMPKNRFRPHVHIELVALDQRGKRYDPTAQGSECGMALIKANEIQLLPGSQHQGHFLVESSPVGGHNLHFNACFLRELGYGFGSSLKRPGVDGHQFLCADPRRDRSAQQRDYTEKNEATRLDGNQGYHTFPYFDSCE